MNLRRTNSRIFIAVGLASLATTGPAWFSFALSTLYPFIQTDLGLTRAQIGLMSSANTLGGVFTLFAGGWFTDKWGIRRTVVVALLAEALPMAAFTLAHSFWPAVLLAAAVGLAGGAIFPPAAQTVLNWVPGRSRAIAMSMVQTGPPLAGILSTAILPGLAIALGWRLPVAALAGVVVVPALLFLSLYRNHPDADSHGSGPLKLSSILHDLIRNRAIVVPTLWGAVFVGVQFTTFTYYVLYLVREASFSPVRAGGYMSILLVSGLISRLVWGGMSDAFFGPGKRPRALVLLGTLVSLVVFTVRFIGPNEILGLTALVTVALGASILSWQGIFSALVGEVAGVGRSGTALGATQVILRLGAVVIPPVFGLLVDSTGSYSFAWTTLSVFALASTAGLAILDRNMKRVATSQA